MEANHLHGDDDGPGASALPTPIVSTDQETTLEGLKQRKAELEPVGKTKVLEIPGYEGKLGVEYQYVGTEETELISKKVMKETKRFGHRGMALLSSIDLLVAACKQIVIRPDSSHEWEPLKPAPVRFDETLAASLDVDAEKPREVVLGVFGSEHAVIEQNMRLSNWLTDVTRDVDDDFFGL